MGDVPNVNEYLQASDVYLSTSYSEGLPNGVLEAMATNIPCILSNIPQHLEILECDQECGLSYVIDDDNDFIKQLQKIHKEDLTKMGNNARMVVEKNFSSKVMSKKYQDVYLRICKGDLKNDQKS